MVTIFVPSPKKDYIRRKEHQRGTKATRRVSQGSSWSEGGPAGQMPGHLSSASTAISLLSCPKINRMIQKVFDYQVRTLTSLPLAHISHAIAKLYERLGYH